MLFELFLVRHGETEFNRAGRIQGSLDSPLTERGRRESEELGQALARSGLRFDRWLVSPQGRAQETSRLMHQKLTDAGAVAAIGAGGADGTFAKPASPEADDLLCEIRCGQYEGMRHADIDPEKLRRLRTRADERYPDGESILDVSDRCRRFLDEWRAQLPADEALPADGVFRTMIVSHGNLLRCLGAVLCDAPPELTVRLLKHNSSVSRIFARDRNFLFRVFSWNETAHLRGEVGFAPVGMM